MDCNRVSIILDDMVLHSGCVSAIVYLMYFFKIFLFCHIFSGARWVTMQNKIQGHKQTKPTSQVH